MRVTVSITMLCLCGLTAASMAQQVPEALLSPPANQVPAALLPPDTNLLTHSLAAKEADAAWTELQDASRRPQPPAAWQAKEPSEKEMSDFLLPYALALMDKAKDFYTRFPTDSHVLE